MSENAGPPIFTNVLMMPTGMKQVMCVLKTQPGQQLLTELRTKGIHVLCGCEQDMGIVEGIKASQIIPWMEQGWIFICTVQQRHGGELFLKFEPIKGLGKTMEVKKEEPSPTVKVKETEDA